jgi:hypothetical protein
MFFGRLKKDDFILLLVFFFSFFSFLSPFCAYAKGRQADVFETVDRLIEERNYNEAIGRLLTIARDEPTLFDKVQTRLRVIVRSSNGYTEIATQLLDTIEQDPGNSGRIFELSQALDTQGAARTEEAREFIQQIQEVARYSVFRNQIEDILLNGRRLIDTGQYADAYDLYLTGFSLYENVFSRSDYPATVKSSATAAQRSVSGMAASFAQLSQRIAPAAGEIAALATSSNNPRRQLVSVTQTLSGIRSELNDLSQMKRAVSNARDEYRSYSEIESRNEGRYYITFANLLINGRSSQNIQEGLLGAVNGLWRAIAVSLENAASSAANGVLSDILEAAHSQNYALARSLLAETEAALRGPTDMLALYDQFAAEDNADNAEKIDVLGERVPAGNVNYFALIGSLNRTLTLLTQAVDYAQNRDAANEEMLTSVTLANYRAKRLTVTQAVQREAGIRTALVGIETGIRSLVTMFQQYLDAMLPLGPAYSGAARGADFFKDGLAFASSIGADLSAAKIASAVRQYTVENEEQALNYPLRLSRFNTASSLANGIQKTLADGRNYISKDPLQASADLGTLTAALSADIAGSRALLARYDTDDADIISTTELAALRTSAATMLASYESMNTRSLAMIADAQRAVAAAEALRTEGARYYRNATEALARNDFDGAYSSLNGSDNQYEASFAVQDSDTIRAEIRARSQSFNAEITQARNNYIRREVDDLVARAQPEFYANNHEAAEQLLIRAQTLFATISDEEDPTVRSWLTVVRNALSLRSGRTIPATAPLYPEMSQLLSSAEIEFTEGMEVLKDQRPQALAYFAGVREKTQEVKLLFPLNQEANLLELRIDQVTDPAAFNATFQERLNAAVTGTKTADLQAFADLQDLAMINPHYRGMSQIINQAEIDMGIRPPPPDEAAIARSRDLTRSAQNLIAGGVRSNLEVAQQQLTEALRVNPANTTALAELDRTERLMGRSAASEREAAVDSDYQQALRELLAGNKLTAYSIVRRILSRPEYQNSGRFQELMLRIESVL